MLWNYDSRMNFLQTNTSLYRFIKWYKMAIKDTGLKAVNQFDYIWLQYWRWLIMTNKSIITLIRGYLLTTKLSFQIKGFYISSRKFNSSLDCETLVLMWGRVEVGLKLEYSLHRNKNLLEYTKVLWRKQSWFDQFNNDFSNRQEAINFGGRQSGLKWPQY